VDFTSIIFGSRRASDRKQAATECSL